MVKTEYPNIAKYIDVVDDEYSEYLATAVKLYYTYGDYLLPATLLNLSTDLIDAEKNISENCEFSTEHYTRTYVQEVVNWG
jgi:hypothetical protein